MFTQGAVPAIFPGPLLPTVLVRTITEDGVQSLLGIVENAGLLAAPPDYSGGDNVADAPNTVLTINADGGDVRAQRVRAWASILPRALRDRSCST